MRVIDLALYADVLAARSAALAAQLERARDGLRQSAIEREARRVLDEAAVARLGRLGALTAADLREQRAEVAELAADLASLSELQAWVEEQLFHAREHAGPLDPEADSPRGGVGRAVEPLAPLDRCQGDE